MTLIKQIVTKNIWTALMMCSVVSILVGTQTAVAQNAFPNPGNVGIGTTSPSDPLQVSSASGVNIRSTDSTNNTSSYLTQVSQWSVWAINRNPITGTKPDSSRTAAQIYFSAASGDSSIHFHTSTTNGADPTERMVIDKNGNVGIGTSTPNRKLELIQDVGGLSFEAGSSSPNSGAIRFGDNTGWKLHFGRSRESNGGALNSGTSGALVTIQDNGNFGIGTTSPTYLLDVAGTVRSSSGGFRFPDNTVQTSAVNYGSSAGTAVQGNTSITLTAGDGMSGGGPLTLGAGGTLTLTNADKGSSQNIFKNVANASGTTQFSAGTNNDAVRFAGSGGTSVTFDAATKKVIIDGSTSTPSAANISAGQFGQNTGGGNYTFPGNVTVNGNIAAKYQDLAEWVPASEQLPAGTVVVLDATKSNQVISSTVSYDTRVAGVISEQPGIALGERSANKLLVATTGRVKVKVDASRAAIGVGDLLVTSNVPGVAMKSEPVNLGGVQLHRPGTLIGKALEPLAKGQGTILVLLSLQ